MFVSVTCYKKNHILQFMLMLDVFLVDYQVKVNYSLIVIFWKGTQLRGKLE